jgi:small subunit ribosomal protein S15
MHFLHLCNTLIFNIGKRYTHIPAIFKKKHQLTALCTFFILLLHSIRKKKNKTVLNNKLMSHLTLERKATIFSTYGGNAKNTGSIEGQVAMITERINHISNHLKTNKKDFSSQRGLMIMVGQRKRLLTYLSKHDLTGYRALIEKLGLRK